MVGVQRSVSNILHFRSQHKWDRLQRKLTKSTSFVLKKNLTKTLMLKKKVSSMFTMYPRRNARRSNN
ncbi:hypothetical protein Hanom_Chr04g00365411 [Helianthus anomalus]